MTPMILTLARSRILLLSLTGVLLIGMNTSRSLAQGFSVSYDENEFVVSPGDSFTATIYVRNMSEETLTLKIYPGDWVRVPGQTSGYEFDEEGGREDRSFLGWMTFSPDRMVLEPGEAGDVFCDINVPDDPDLQGSYWGVVFIEDSPEERIENETSSDAGTVVGILTAFRYAVQIYATIENSAVRDATFTSIDFQAVDEGFEVIAVLENKGNIFLRPEVRLELRDAYGNSVFEQEHVRQTILPESSREYVFQLTNLPVEPGPYLVMVVADYGVPTLIAAQGRVIIESSKADQAEE